MRLLFQKLENQISPFWCKKAGRSECGRGLVMFALAVALLLSGCRDPKTKSDVVWEVDYKLLNEEPFRITLFLERIHTVPQGATPSKRDMLNVASLLMNANALAKAHGDTRVCVPVKSELFVVIDRYLSGNQRWIETKRKNGCVDLEETILVIESTR